MKNNIYKHIEELVVLLWMTINIIVGILLVFGVGLDNFTSFKSPLAIIAFCGFAWFSASLGTLYSMSCKKTKSGAKSSYDHSPLVVFLVLSIVGSISSIIFYLSTISTYNFALQTIGVSMFAIYIVEMISIYPITKLSNKFNLYRLAY